MRRLIYMTTTKREISQSALDFSARLTYACQVLAARYPQGFSSMPQRLRAALVQFAQDADLALARSVVLGYVEGCGIDLS